MSHTYQELYTALHKEINQISDLLSRFGKSRALLCRRTSSQALTVSEEAVEELFHNALVTLVEPRVSFMQELFTVKSADTTIEEDSPENETAAEEYPCYCSYDRTTGKLVVHVGKLLHACSLHEGWSPKQYADYLREILPAWWGLPSDLEQRIAKCLSEKTSAISYDGMMKSLLDKYVRIFQDAEDKGDLVSNLERGLAQLVDEAVNWVKWDEK